MQSDGDKWWGEEYVQHEGVEGPYDNAPEQSGKVTAPSESGHTPVNDDGPSRTAYYNAASEKSLSHQEAKLFFQRHQFEQSQQDFESTNSLSRARTYPSAIANDEGLSRTASTASYRSTRGHASRDRNSGVPTLAPDSTIHSPALDGTAPNTSEDDAHIVLDQINEGGVSEKRSRLASGVGSVTMPVSDISPELSAISTNIKEILDVRHKYIDLSLQGPGDNPKDGPNWNIYPPPPNPTWDNDKNRPTGYTSSGNSLSNSRVLPDRSNSPEHSRLSSKVLSPDLSIANRRKPGRDIGEDFDMAEVFPLPGNDESTAFKLDQGSIYQVYKAVGTPDYSNPLVRVPTLREFYKDMDQVQAVSSDGPTKSFAYRQLDIIEGKFHLYFLVNSYQETADCKRVPHRDFYNVRKVDTHVHHSACMNQKHLLRFIKSKMKKSPDEIVMFRDGKELSLQQVFESINLTAYDLSIDTLDMHAHTDSFHRFDKFNLKYNPIGESRLREIFLKTDNYIKGRYLAEITKEVIADLESSKYQFVEWRVSIYGRSIDEWDKLAAWVIDNKLVSHNVRWLVQIPRLYSLYRANGQMSSYEQILINIFQPLYEVTKDPSSHDKLHVFLQRVIGFDSVDDESKIEVRLYRRYPPPKEWTTKQNPPYTYWIYHLFANMASLNQWRRRRGFNTLVLRPHCGEAGDVDHIAAAVLCCHSISHGLMLRKVPLLQYIFYLDQIGIAMSPLSNNALFLAYERNPFSKYFKRGLNVSLSTDDPLQFAFTKEPLIEEYSVAAQIYRFSAVDMCELAHHSVIQSGFEHELKQRWLGPNYHLPGVDGNNVAKSNVPNIREQFRHDTLMQELDMLDRYAAAFPPGQSKLIPARPAASPPVSVHSATNPASQPRTTASPSNTDVKNLDLGGPRQNHVTPIRSSTTVISPSQANTPYWSDMASTPPRIFPGVVHERTRRGSMRQGSGSEKDLDGGEAPRSVPYGHDVKGYHGAVLEESGVHEGLKRG